MKKITLILTVGFVSLATYLFPQEMPDGNCMTCDTCDDSYIIYESDMVDSTFDKMNNCALGSETKVTGEGLYFQLMSSRGYFFSYMLIDVQV